MIILICSQSERLQLSYMMRQSVSPHLNSVHHLTPVGWTSQACLVKGPETNRHELIQALLDGIPTNHTLTKACNIVLFVFHPIVLKCQFEQNNLQYIWILYDAVSKCTAYLMSNFSQGNVRLSI